MRILGLGVLLVGLNACTMIKNMEEMHDATLELRDLSKGLSTKTDRVGQTAADTYTDLRQGEALKARMHALEALDHSDSIKTKIEHAAAYFMSFEFQLWKGHGADSEERRFVLFNDAVAEFFRAIGDYVDEDMEIDPASDNNQLENLHALAAAMHRVNSNQKLTLKKLATEKGWHVQPFSMFTLIKMSLARKTAIESGEVSGAGVPDYIRTVLENEQVAIYMLRLRANFLAAAILPRISNIRDRGLIGVWPFPQLSIYLNMMNTEWDVDFSRLNSVQLASVGRWMRGAAATREFLVRLGVDPKIDSDIRAIYAEMQVPLPKLAEGQAATPRHRAIEAFTAELDRFRNRVERK